MAKSRSAVRILLILTAAILLASILPAASQSHAYGGSEIGARSAGFDVSGADFEDSFRTINRRSLQNCRDANPYLKLTTDTQGPLADVQNVTVTVSGVVDPSDDDWIAVVSPSDAKMSGPCEVKHETAEQEPGTIRTAIRLYARPGYDPSQGPGGHAPVCKSVNLLGKRGIMDCAGNEVLYLETGDTAKLPLLCHYPVKFQFVSNDPGYLSCANSNCSLPGLFGSCTVKTCSGSITFRLINIRTDILFILFTGGLDVPCILEKAEPLSFANPNSSLYSHLSSIDSSGNSMRLTWVSGGAEPQTVQYATNSTVTSTVSTFSQTDVCDSGPARDFGWHNPGYIHTAIMTGLSPSTPISYQYGSTTVGFSALQTFTTPPAAGDNAVEVIIYGDMGKAERDNSSIHYIQPGSLSVIDAVTTAVSGGGVDFVFHIGDISYATGFLVEWENFLDIIEPVASQIPYMTAMGNHERDQPNSGSYYNGTDSGGECGIPYYNYFQMPAPANAAQGKAWYSIESGPVHFTIIDTETDWNNGTEQYSWIQSDLASVNRTTTPWVVYAGHRPMYSSLAGSLLNDLLPSVDLQYRSTIEPLLFNAKVDLALAGHVHNYERLCAVYQGNCLQNSSKDVDGVDTFNFTTYAAPVQAVIGMSGFTLDPFTSNPDSWSTVRISDYGYCLFQATPQKLEFQFVYANGTVGDVFAIVK